MKKKAILNGQLVQLGAGTSSKCNVFLNSRGFILGLGYVPDLDDDEFDQIDLKGGAIFPYVTNVSYNALDDLDQLKDVSSPILWSSELNLLEEVESVSKIHGDSVLVLPTLTLHGQYLNDLATFYSSGYVSFYQNIFDIDVTILQDSLRDLSVLKGSVLLDGTDFQNDDYIDNLVQCIPENLNATILFKGIHTINGFNTLVSKNIGKLSIVIDLILLLELSKIDYNQILELISSGFISGVYSSFGIKHIIDSLRGLQLDTITIAKLLSGTFLMLKKPEFMDWSVNDRPNVVLESSSTCFSCRQGILYDSTIS